MKIRLGALTGTMADVAGDGIYWADDVRGVCGVQAIYYGVKDGVAVKLWPGEGAYRIVSLRLHMSDSMAALLTTYAAATNDFRSAGARMTMTAGKRSWMRNPTRTDIAWDAASMTLTFLNNTGPLADTILRGDYLTMAAMMGSWTQVFEVPKDRPISGGLECVGSFKPVTDCTVYAGADWYMNAEQGAAGVQHPNGAWLLQVQAQEASGKSKKSGGVTRFGQEATRAGVTGGPYSVWLMGRHAFAGVKVTYPENRMTCSARVVEVTVKE